MDDAPCMHRGETAPQALQQPLHLVRLQPPPCHDRLQSLAFDELHDEEAHPLLVAQQPLVVDDRVIAHAAKLAHLRDQELDQAGVVGDC